MTAPDPSVPGSHRRAAGARVEHAWIHRLAIPAWVTGPEGTMQDANVHAVRALEQTGQPWCGAPCHRIVAGQDWRGAPVCGARCRVRERARTTSELPPVVMRVGRGRGSWLEVITIPIDGDNDRPGLVHCARPVEAQQRMAAFLRGVAARSGSAADREPLSRREVEILEHMAHGEPTAAIAAKLFVSPTTVRNHVQHILRKLRVHSILEAIAVHLLGVADPAEDLPDGGGWPLP